MMKKNERKLLGQDGEEFLCLWFHSAERTPGKSAIFET